MKVRVKEGETGFFNNRLMKEGDVFVIEAKTHSVKKDDKGNPVVISEKDQFSNKWMEVIEAPKAKAKPGPKPKPDIDPTEE